MSGYSADLMLKHRLLPPMEMEGFLLHSIVMPCHVLISMHDMQEFNGEHLHKLALSFLDAKGRHKAGALGEERGREI